MAYCPLCTRGFTSSQEMGGHYTRCRTQHEAQPIRPFNNDLTRTAGSTLEQRQPPTHSAVLPSAGIASVETPPVIDLCDEDGQHSPLRDGSKVLFKRKSWTNWRRGVINRDGFIVWFLKEDTLKMHPRKPIEPNSSDVEVKLLSE